MSDGGLLFEGDSKFGHYQVADTVYLGRPARVLYSGDHRAAQSALAKDDRPELPFDYNERFLELARSLRPDRMLLIGGGACTLPRAVLKEFPEIAIDIVEPDRLLLDLARKYFDFEPSKHTKLCVDDGRHYLEATTKSYDLVFIDAFADTIIPQSLQTEQAVSSLKRCLDPTGTVAMNVIAAGYGERSTILIRLVNAFQTIFNNVQVFPASSSISLWTPQNFILTAQNDTKDLHQYLRYGALSIGQGRLK